MKNFTDNCLGILIIYGMINFLPLIFGMVDGQYARPNTCNSPTTRIGYVIPGYKLGCWLGSPVGSQ